MKIIYKVSALTALLVMLNACQLSPAQPEKTNQAATVSYSHYYLWLKTLSTTELFIEVKQLQRMLLSTANNNDKKQQLESKLLLIYSLPNPSIYQPYKAKALLNKYPLPDNTNNVTDSNLAFMVMLRDQLNSQLHLLRKQAQSKADYLADQAKKDVEIERLKKLLAQLKAIEKNISDHSLAND